MKDIRFSVLVKRGNKWECDYTKADVFTVYKALAEDLQAKYVMHCKYITRIIQRPNYDGTRNITVYFDNGVKHEFIVYS